MMLVHGKGRKQRLIPIPMHLVIVLARYQSMRNESRSYKEKCDRFFRSRQGGAITTTSLTLMISRVGINAGVMLYSHLLRHKFVTMFMANDGADVLSLQAICGWSTLAMATRYSHLYKNGYCRLTETEKYNYWCILTPVLDAMGSQALYECDAGHTTELNGIKFVLGSAFHKGVVPSICTIYVTWQTSELYMSFV